MWGKEYDATIYSALLSLCSFLCQSYQPQHKINLFLRTGFNSIEMKTLEIEFFHLKKKKN